MEYEDIYSRINVKTRPVEIAKGVLSIATLRAPF
jgi:hypothetical protein